MSWADVMLLRTRQMANLDKTAFYLSGEMAMITFCLNPLIYVSRYEVFRRYLKEMLNKNTATTTQQQWLN